MFDRLLIANRDEIACRVIKTAPAWESYLVIDKIVAAARQTSAQVTRARTGCGPGL